MNNFSLNRLGAVSHVLERFSFGWARGSASLASCMMAECSSSFGSSRCFTTTNSRAHSHHGSGTAARWTSFSLHTESATLSYVAEICGCWQHGPDNWRHQALIFMTQPTNTVLERLTKWHLLEWSLIQFVLGEQTRWMSCRDSVSGFIRSINLFSSYEQTRLTAGPSPGWRETPALSSLHKHIHGIAWPYIRFPLYRRNRKPKPSTHIHGNAFF